MISNLINRKIFTLLKVQYSNMLEYRVEIALWAISGIIPFFMLNIWTNNNLNESINIENNSITSSLKTILNNCDIEDLFINEPPIDEVIGKVLIKKDYDI